MKPFIALLLACVAGHAFASDSNIEKMLRDLDSQWSSAAAAKDLTKIVSFYSDDAMVLPPNAPAVTTRDSITAFWKGTLDAVSSISWNATRVEVAKSGDMAYVSGTYQLAMKDATAGAANDHGKYLVVWEKQADGSWKCGADMFSSDLPAAAAGQAGEKK